MARPKAKRNISFAKRVLITDPKLLLDAPRDYFVAGLADTLAKWYESETILRQAHLQGNPFTISGSDRQAFARSDYAGLKSSLSGDGRGQTHA